MLVIIHTLLATVVVSISLYSVVELVLLDEWVSIADHSWTEAK